MARTRTHGHTSGGRESPTYRSWNLMWQRCRNDKCAKYPQYGGRGITVCERWLKFENFLEDMGLRPKGKTLDRVNNNLGYYPENCRWATNVEQNNNRRNSILLTCRGETLTLPQWARRLGINQKTLRKRLYQGWPIEQALETPTQTLSKGVA